MAHPLFWWLGLAGLGTCVGVVAGMFGVGGGFLLTPLLAVLFRLPLPVAVGTGLCQMGGVATASLLRHLRLRQGEIKIDWQMMAGSLLGVGLGTGAVRSLAGMGRVTAAGHGLPAAKLALSAGYVLLLGGVAAWMLRDSRRPSRAASPAAPLSRVRWPPMTLLPRTGRRVSVPLIAYLGLGMGFLSGLLGIGGGVALMPVLIYGLGMPIRVAAGTGILVLLATALTGTAAYALMGDVNLPVALTLLIGSTLGAQAGATLTSRLPAPRLRALFAGLVALTALAVLWDLIRDWQAGA